MPDRIAPCRAPLARFTMREEAWETRPSITPPRESMCRLAHASQGCRGHTELVHVHRRARCRISAHPRRRPTRSVRDRDASLSCGGTRGKRGDVTALEWRLDRGFSGARPPASAASSFPPHRRVPPILGRRQVAERLFGQRAFPILRLSPALLALTARSHVLCAVRCYPVSLEEAQRA